MDFDAFLSDLQPILGVIMPIVYILVGIALVWFIVELIATIRKTRKTVDVVNEQLQPTLANVNRLTAELEPTVENLQDISGQIKPMVSKVDPLVDRVSLTVDAANLEIMRVDQILEDVTQITGSVSKTIGTVDTVTSAPLELVNTVTDKVRNRLKPRYASDESVKLGNQPAVEPNPVRDFVDAASDVASSTVSDMKSRASSRKAARAERAKSAQTFESSLDRTADTLVDAVAATTKQDTPAADAAQRTASSVSSAAAATDRVTGAYAASADGPSIGFGADAVQSAQPQSASVDAATKPAYVQAGSATPSSYGKHAAAVTAVGAGAAVAAATAVTANHAAASGEAAPSTDAAQTASADITAPIKLPDQDTLADASADKPIHVAFSDDRTGAQSARNAQPAQAQDASGEARTAYEQEVSFEQGRAEEDYWNGVSAQTMYASADAQAPSVYDRSVTSDGSAAVPSDAASSAVQVMETSDAVSVPAANAQAVIAAASAALESHKQAAFDVLYGEESAETPSGADGTVAGASFAAGFDMPPASSETDVPSFARSAAQTASVRPAEGFHTAADQTSGPAAGSGSTGQIDAHEALRRAIEAARKNAAQGGQTPTDSAE